MLAPFRFGNGVAERKSEFGRGLCRRRDHASVAQPEPAFPGFDRRTVGDDFRCVKRKILKGIGRNQFGGILSVRRNCSIASILHS
ncbi:hypothetical protein OCK01_01160 [Rhizobium sp. TRM95796]|nr:hypothetical protein [Rhizobium sp. TRM95796]MCV3764189.1 hypothetical protein [Rhizobium sp. TRM95796]